MQFNNLIRTFHLNLLVAGGFIITTAPSGQQLVPESTPMENRGILPMPAHLLFCLWLSNVR